jgi:2'-5' RNA ligase
MPYKNNYIAVSIPDTIKAQISLIQGVIKSIDPQFKEMGFNELHMTLVFLGKMFNGVKKEVIQDFDKNVKDIIDGSFKMEFSNPIIQKFPPGKQNLVVIKFNYNENAFKLHKIMYDTYGNNSDKFENWTPHITIGKLRDNTVDLSEVEKNINTMLDSKFNSDSIYLAGASSHYNPSWTLN